MRLLILELTLGACLLGVQHPLAGENPMPFMVHSDAKRYQGDDKTPGCVLLITANNINGEYISAVIKLLRKTSGYTTEYIVSSGNIDYTNGREVFDYVEEAWLTTSEQTTRGQVDIRRGPNPNAYKGIYTGADAKDLYEDLVKKPFELTLITSLHSAPYTHRFEQPFDQIVAGKARNCLDEIDNTRYQQLSRH